jgi:predicted metal-dependent hydrolase
MPLRLIPDLALPPYTFVPGCAPHPVRDPGGHLYGVPQHRPDPLDPANWPASRDYLFGIDLFNQGYYWEAHEKWEGLWLAAGRTGLTADFLKGLIKLAAAGVKVREGVPRGVADHAAGAANIFREVARHHGGETPYLGLRPAELIDFTHQVTEQAAAVRFDGGTGVKVVFSFALQPEPLPSSTRTAERHMRTGSLAGGLDEDR